MQATAIKLPPQVQRLLNAKVLKPESVTPRVLAVLRRLSGAEVRALISMRRKFGGTVRVIGGRCGFIPL